MKHIYYIVRPREWVRGTCEPKRHYETVDTYYVYDGLVEIMACHFGDVSHHYLVKEY